MARDNCRACYLISVASIPADALAYARIIGHDKGCALRKIFETTAARQDESQKSCVICGPYFFGKCPHVLKCRTTTKDGVPTIDFDHDALHVTNNENEGWWARAWKIAAKKWREAAHWRNNYAIVERDAALQEAERLKTEVARLESFFSAEGLRDERDRLREALRSLLEFAPHMYQCGGYGNPAALCDCGLEPVAAAARRALGEPTE